MWLWTSGISDDSYKPGYLHSGCQIPSEVWLPVHWPAKKGEPWEQSVFSGKPIQCAQLSAQALAPLSAGCWGMGSSASHLWLTPGSYVSFPLPPNSLFLNPCHVLFWNPSRTLVHGRWQCCRNSTYMTQSVPQVDYKSCTVLGLSFLNGTTGT